MRIVYCNITGEEEKMARQKIDYERESINLYASRNSGETVKIDGFSFERYPLMNNNLDCGYNVWHGDKLIDVYQHYAKQSHAYDLCFSDFKTYMKWLRGQVKAQKVLKWH